MMKIKYDIRKQPGPDIALAGLAALLLASCGGGGEGPAISANTQTISFGAAPALNLSGTATVSATSSSGLAVSYSSTTSSICSVNSSTGLVTDITAGTCIIAANQPGNSTYAPAAQVTQRIPVIFDPNQTISFGSAPTLSLGGTTTVSAASTSGLAVSYSSATATVCTVNSSTGLVTDLTAGTCTIAADQAGDANFNAAPQATQSIAVSASSGTTVPGAPTGVTATAGNASNQVVVSIGATDSGGSHILGYSVTSSPAGITASGTASPITVTCPTSCAGYAFSAYATNAVGDGASSNAADVITGYRIVETFHEPDTQPNDSIFIGTFTLNSTTGTVANLQGTLSESMTGGLTGYPNDTMTWLPLNYQLSAVYDASLGGLLVTTFKNSNTNTLTTNPAYGGGDGWSQGLGMGYYYSYPGANPGNAYARIFVNVTDPTASLTFAQIQALAYVDCAPGGMMGNACMTGYGGVGTMGGYPVSQTITKQ